ncbi:hypothetical protein ACFL5V_01330 [Fibrobacterota bacterium]
MEKFILIIIALNIIASIIAKNQKKKRERKARQTEQKPAGGGCGVSKTGPGIQPDTRETRPKVLSRY